jgi:hypothetical protein
VAGAAEVLWQTAGRIGAHRLQPFVPELLDRLARFGELPLAPAVDKLLRHASAATLGRLLAPARARYPARGATTTRPGTWLKHEIPIRTFTDWDDAQPGLLEIDLVAHCGSSTLGFYLCTLCTVDIVTCWVELEAVWGKGQARVGGAVQHMHARLPMPLLGLDSDNGSEFINQGLYDYCQRHTITFTRSRAWKKNDSAHVEQRTAPSSAASSAMIATRPKPPMRNSLASISSPARTSISSSPCRSWCAKLGTARARGATTMPHRLPISASVRPACSRPPRERRGTPCTLRSIRRSSAATSNASSSGFGRSPRPTPTAPPALSRSLPRLTAWRLAPPSPCAR